MNEEKTLPTENSKGKEKKRKYRSITEVAAILSVEPHVLRYWEEELELKIDRSETGRRMYREEDINLFRKILHFKDMGYRMKDMKKMLKLENDMVVESISGKADERENTMIYPWIDVEEKEQRKNPVARKNRFIYQMDAPMEMSLEKKTLQKAEKANFMFLEKEYDLKEKEDIVRNQVVSLDEDKAMKVKRIQELIVQAFTQSIQTGFVEMKGQLSSELKEVVQKELDYQFRIQEEKQNASEKERIAKEDAWMKEQELHFQKIDELLRNRRGKRKR